MTFPKLLPRTMTCAFLLALLLPAARASAYIEAFYSLGRVINESTNIFIAKVETVDKVKNTIIYRKIKDLKGTHPGQTMKHMIGQGGFNPREWQFIMQWAEPGQIAVIFHQGSICETCIQNYWYQSGMGDWCTLVHGEPYLLRTFCGRPEKLATAVQALLAGQEALVPCMVDGDKMSLQLRTAKLQRLRTSLKIQDFDQKRDFAGWGVEDFRSLQGMGAFLQYGPIPRVDPEAIGIAPCDFDGDGKIDFCLYGATRAVLLQNAGGSMNEVPLTGLTGGARAACWADYDGDGKPDLFLATPAGPKLYHNKGGGAFEDVSALVPVQPYWNITAAQWIDYDGDGKPDLLIADGFRGLRLLRNKGVPKDESSKMPSTMGKWYYCGPFDNTGGKGFDAAYPPEAEGGKKVDLTATYPGKGNAKVAWKEGNFADGQVNNLQLFEPQNNEYSAVYLYRELFFVGPSEVPVSLGSDDTLTVWLNGEKVLAENTSRACAPDTTQLKLKFKAGKNKLLLKVCQGGGPWAFYFKANIDAAAAKVGPPIFEDVSDQVGLGSGGIAAGVSGDRLLVADVNGDGKPDFLFTGGRGVLAINSGGKFVESKDSGLSFATGGITPVFGDWAGDGKLGLFVPQPVKCQLYRNDGKGHFADVTDKAGHVAMSFAAGAGDPTCATFADFNKTGRLDLLVGCLKGPNRLFRNNGDGTFTDASEDAGFFQRTFNTRALAVLDINKDGIPDLVLNNEGQESAILLGNPARVQAKPAAHADAGAPKEMATPAPAAAPTSAIPNYALVGGGIAFVLGAVVFALLLPRKLKVHVFLLVAALAATSARADWPAARGNSQRTGNIDGQPGPIHPKILWVHKAQESFVASAVPGGDAIFSSGLGAFNTAAFHAMAAGTDPKQRLLWSKTPPFVKLPIVSTPAYLQSAAPNGVVIFGDGMHQTDGATLYCLTADTGRVLWRYNVDGHLVHMEGAPAVANDKVYVGGGDAGVMCFDPYHPALDGKDIDLPTARDLVEKKWKELDAKFQEAKKKDPDFAVPPSEDALPKPQPKLLWQQGKGGKWHVDAPVAAAGDKVLVCSAYLDDEKSGKRAVICLNAADGAPVWEVAMKYNPWAGATIAGVSTTNAAGTTALVACSSIRFDAKMVKGAKGEVVALDLATGGVKWRKEIPGGVLSPVAVLDDLAVASATDGKVYAWDALTGADKWVYTAATPFFAGPAVVGTPTAGVAYVADLKGTVHALNLSDGKVRWTLNVSTDPMVSAPGTVFGSPVLDHGRLYVSTCNLEGESELSVVACIGDASDSAGDAAAAKITIDKVNRRIYVPCRIAPRKLPSLSEIYPIEVVACAPSPRGQKAHETIITVEAKPSEVHAAMEELGLHAGHPAMADTSVASGPEVNISLEVPGLVGTPRVVPIERTLVDPKTGKPMPKLHWLFTGSVLKQPDPDKPDKVYGADSTGTLIAIFPVTDETVFQAQLTMRDEPLLKIETNFNVLPEIGTPCRLIISAK